MRTMRQFILDSGLSAVVERSFPIGAIFHHKGDVCFLSSKKLIAIYYKGAMINIYGTGNRR